MSPKRLTDIEVPKNTPYSKHHIFQPPRKTGVHLNDDQASNIIIFDSMNVIFRVVHRVGHLTTAAGIPSGHVFGVLRMVQSTIKKYGQPDCVIIFAAEGIDAHKPRLAVYPNYKGQREHREDSTQLISEVFRVLHFLPVYVMHQTETEADDVINLLCRVHPTQKITVVSKDKDLWALLQYPQVQVLFGDTLVTKDQIMHDFGVMPDKIPFYKALYGDTSDNIPPAIPRFPRHANFVNRIMEFGQPETFVTEISAMSAEELKKNGFSEKVQAAVIEHKNALIRNWHLTQFQHIPVHESTTPFIGSPDLAVAREIVRYYELKSLYDFVDELFENV